eukprot:Gregarina_sp_Poly_1__2314@NODE_1619_length_3701_cov_20_287562_g1066_i0_p2_GENE_NODE_1619_length_3701_cov_20_287562_g1066_i0NODE_1619_length_3701_cov_20_287562_g1066_i0_p2_ORF_typecomplete_len286_score29_022OGFeII_Oxy_2/PF13532_6/0_00013_NODE_1619_length_3701_cov_20_287562_g1066_i025493406
MLPQIIVDIKGCDKKQRVLCRKFQKSSTKENNYFCIKRRAKIHESRRDGIIDLQELERAGNSLKFTIVGTGFGNRLVFIKIADALESQALNTQFSELDLEIEDCVCVLQVIANFSWNQIDERCIEIVSSQSIAPILLALKPFVIDIIAVEVVQDCVRISPSPLIPGIILQSEFVSEAEEQYLIEFIDCQPWQRSLKRRVQHYGYTFDYKTLYIIPRKNVAPHIPREFDFVTERLRTAKYFDWEPDQLTINEYEPGDQFLLDIQFFYFITLRSRDRFSRGHAFSIY